MVISDARGLHQEKDGLPCSGTESNVETCNIGGLSSQPSTPPQSTNSPESTRKRRREETYSSKKAPRPKPKIHRPKVVFDHVFKKKPPKNAKTPRPKVGVEGKPKRTPKAKTPKASSTTTTTTTPKPSTPNQSSPRKKRKNTRRNSVKNEDVEVKTGCKNEGAEVQNLEDAVKSSTKEVAEDNPKCIEKSCRRTLNFDMDSRMNKDLLETTFAISSANNVVAQESLGCIETSMTGSLNFDSECQMKREPPRIIHQYQRRKKRWALAYKLVESKLLLERLRPNFPKAFNKRRKNRKRGKTSLEVVSPTRDQFRAALNDPDSFRCVISLHAVRKSKRRTSTTRRRRLTYLDANPNLDQLPTRRLAYPNVIPNLNELPLTSPVKFLNGGMGGTEPVIDENREFKACELKACVEVICDDKENMVQPAIEVQFEGNENMVEPIIDINGEFKACMVQFAKQFAGKENMVEFAIDINREACMEFHFEGKENMMQPAVDNVVNPASYHNEIQGFHPQFEDALHCNGIQRFHPQFEDVLHEAKTGPQQEAKAALDQGDDVSSLKSKKKKQHLKCIVHVYLFLVSSGATALKLVTEAHFGGILFQPTSNKFSLKFSQLSLTLARG